MAFTMGFTLAKDSAGNAIPGGLLSADIAGGGVGPTLPFHSLVDGVAGANRIAIDSSNRMAVLAVVASAGVASGAFASGALASGSIAAGAMVDLLTMRGTKAPGTAATNSILGGGVYNLTPPTFTDGQGGALQLTSAGALLVSGSSGATEYTEDAAAAANPVGAMTMLRRFDTPVNSTVSADGDNFAWQGNAYGAGYVVAMDKFGTISDYTLGSEIQGDLAHDAVFTASNPIVMGGYAKAAAPTDVSADGDVVNAWYLRNGAQATVLTAAGALIGGDATNGLDVDITRVPADPYGVNADAASASGSISAKLRGIATALGITALDLGSGTGGTRTLRSFIDTAQWVGGTLTFASQGYSAAVSLTRTADTNAYAANDVIGAATGSTAALTFANMGPSGKDVIITSVQMELDITSIPSGMTSFRLYLYNVTPPSALGDNVAFDLPSGDRASYLGYVDLGTPVDLGSTLYVEANAINKQVKLSGTSLFGYLVTIGAYTPTSAAVKVITMHAVAP